MKWILAAPYKPSIEHGLWQAVKQKNSEIELFISPTLYQHDRSRSHSNLSQWKDYWIHSKHAWAEAQQKKAGIITAFPQLAACTAMRKKISRNRSIPLIASTFNIGSLPNNYKKTLSRSALRHIDKFIVPSSAEKIEYSEYLNLPLSRFEFIPLHRPIIEPDTDENKEKPFILSMGSANRDYATLFKAIKDLPYKLIVVCPRERIINLSIPENVEVVSNLTIDECRNLVQKARLNIVPIQNQQTASGQVTVIEAMMFKKAVIATNTIGTTDYIEHGKTGWLTDNQSVDNLIDAIEILWADDTLRNTIAAQAQRFVKEELSYEKTASKYLNVLDSFN